MVSNINIKSSDVAKADRNSMLASTQQDEKFLWIPLAVEVVAASVDHFWGYSERHKKKLIFFCVFALAEYTTGALRLDACSATNKQEAAIGCEHVSQSTPEHRYIHEIHADEEKGKKMFAKYCASRLILVRLNMARVFVALR